MPKSVSKMLSNDMLVLLGGLLVVYLLVQYMKGKSSPRLLLKRQRLLHQKMLEHPRPAPSAPPPAASPTPNEPQDLLPQDSNSEWSEFAPQGQGDLLGSGSLLHPQISQRPFNSVQEPMLSEVILRFQLVIFLASPLLLTLYRVILLVSTN